MSPEPNINQTDEANAPPIYAVISAKYYDDGQASRSADKHQGQGE